MALDWGSLLGGLISGGTQLYGISQQNKASEEMQRAAQQSVNMLAPYTGMGDLASAILKQKLAQGFPSTYEEFAQSPYYQVSFKEGTRALERSAAARGNQLSGGQLKRLQDYGQKALPSLYSQYQQNWLQSLTPYQSALGLGQTAAQAGSQLNLQVGEAKAAGNLGMANTIAKVGDWAGNQLTQLYPQINSLLNPLGNINYYPGSLESSSPMEEPLGYYGGL